MALRRLATVAPPESTQDRQAEMALLGALIVASDQLPGVREILAPEDLAYPAHAAIYRTLIEMGDSRQPIDAALLLSALRAQGRAEVVGGAAYVHELVTGCPDVSRALEYARNVVSAARRRRAIETMRAASVSVARGIVDGDVSRTVAALQELQTSPAERRARSVPRLVRLSEVEPCRVRWVWPGWIPAGKLSILDGDPALGKSLVTVDLAARVSRGYAMPDGRTGDLGAPAGVVILSAEDDPRDTIRPRLDAAGADVSRIALLTRVTREGRGYPPSLADIEALRTAIVEMGAALVIVDPLMAHVADADTHVDADIRSLLAPVADLAAETGAAVLAIRHLRKSGGGNPLYAGGGSIGIIGAARAGLLVAADPDDPDGRRRVLAPTKSNLGAAPTPLSYEVEPAGDVARIRWTGTSGHGAAALLRIPEDGEGSALEEGVRFLEEELGAGCPARDLQQRARSAGIHERTLRRAKDRLGVVARKIADRWVWVRGTQSDHHEGDA